MHAMLIVVGFFLIVGAIFYGALRILLGWFAPAGTVAAMDRAVGATIDFIGKLGLLAVAGFLLWAFIRGG